MNPKFQHQYDPFHCRLIDLIEFASLAAVAQEKKNQRETLRKQHDDYMRRAAALKRELVILKEQKGELYIGNEPPSPTTNGFLKENDRLQVRPTTCFCFSSMNSS